MNTLLGPVAVSSFDTRVYVTGKALKDQEVGAMTKSELIAMLAEEMQMPRRRAEEAVNCIFQSMSEALAQGQRIEIRGLGSFALKAHKAYTGRNPRSGEPVDVDSKYAIHFKPGKELRERVNEAAEN